MYLAIIGSRSIKEIDFDAYIKQKPECVITGGAIGVDTLAEEWARRNNIRTIIIKPNYEKYKKYAPLKRNHEIVNECDEIIAFWDGRSKGTYYTMQLAQKEEKKLTIVNIV